MISTPRTHAIPPDVTAFGTVVYHTSKFGPVVLQPGPNGRFCTRDGTDLPTDIKALEDIGCDIPSGLRIALVRKTARLQMDRERQEQERIHRERIRELEAEARLREQQLIQQGLRESGVYQNPYGPPSQVPVAPPANLIARQGPAPVSAHRPTPDLPPLQGQDGPSPVFSS